MPGSLAEMGFVPPVEKMKEKAAPPDENVPVDPNGLVIVSTFEATTHEPKEAEITPEVDDKVQAD